MSLKAFEPKKLKFQKMDHNILAQTSSSKDHRPHTGHVFSSTLHKVIGQLGWQTYEFQLMDYLVIIVGVSVLIAVVIVACVCFPPYKSEEQREEEEKKRAKAEEEEKKKKAKEEDKAKADEEK